MEKEYDEKWKHNTRATCAVIWWGREELKQEETKVSKWEKAGHWVQWKAGEGGAGHFRCAQCLGGLRECECVCVFVANTHPSSPNVAVVFWFKLPINCLMIELSMLSAMASPTSIESPLPIPQIFIDDNSLTTKKVTTKCSVDNVCC